MEVQDHRVVAGDRRSPCGGQEDMVIMARRFVVEEEDQRFGDQAGFLDEFARRRLQAGFLGVDAASGQKNESTAVLDEQDSPVDLNDDGRALSFHDALGQRQSVVLDRDERLRLVKIAGATAGVEAAGELVGDGQR